MSLPPDDRPPLPPVPPVPPLPPLPPAAPRLRIATTSLGGCFGCHTSLCDIDERLFALAEVAQFDRSPLTDIKQVSPGVDIGLIEGAVCNAENVLVLREFRAHCRVLVAVGACAVNGGLPAERNRLDVGMCLQRLYPGRGAGAVPDDPELPLLLDRVRPINEVVRIDHFLPGCPPSADAIWKFLTDLIAGRMPRLTQGLLHFD